MKFSPLPVIVGLSCLSLCHAVLADGAARVIPRPQIQDYGHGLIQWEPQAAHFKVAFKNISPAASAACKNGFQFLSKRLTLLGAGDATIEERRGQAHLVITRSSAKDFSRMLCDRGALGEVTGKRLEQAYALVCRPAYRNRGSVQITACSDLGIYYGLVSLCQLLDKDERGAFVCRW